MYNIASELKVTCIWDLIKKKEENDFTQCEPPHEVKREDNLFLQNLFLSNLELSSPPNPSVEQSSECFLASVG